MGVRPAIVKERALRVVADAEPQAEILTMPAAHAAYLLDLLTGTETVQDSLRKLTEAAAHAISGLAGVEIDCAATLNRDRRPAMISANNRRAATLAALEDGGPMADALGSAGSVVVGTYGGSLAVPVRLDETSSCALTLLGPAGFQFSPEVVTEAHRFAAVASQSLKLAIEVHGIRAAGDNLKAVLEARKSIDVACGVIMAQTRCSYPDAFSKLASASRHRNLHVRSVAEGVLTDLPATQRGNPGR